MGYPAAYRNNSSRIARSGGYQKPVGGIPNPRPGSGWPLPQPANDNLPVPANDNSAARAAERKAARYFGKKMGARLVGRVASRFIPLLGEALLAWDLYEAWKQLNYLGPVGSWKVAGNWVKYAQYCQQDIGRPVSGALLGAGVCGATYQVKDVNETRPVRPTDLYFHFSKWASPSVLGYSYYEMYSMWHRVSAGQGRVLARAMAPLSPASVPSIPWPSLDPASIPVGSPALTPQPIPYSVLPHVKPSPDAPPKEQLEVGYDYPPNNLPDLYPDSVAPPVPDFGDGDEPPPDEPIIRISYKYLVDIVLRMVWEIVFHLASGTESTVKPRVLTKGKVKVQISNKHAFRPPRKGEKEKKFILSPSANNLFRRLFDIATEVDDFVDALYRALPKEDRLHGKWVQDPTGRWHWRNPSLAERAQQVLTHSDDLNGRQALKNLVKNEINDRLYGKLGQTSARAAQHVGNATPYKPTRTATVSRRGTGGLIQGPDPIGDAVDWAFDQLWPT